MSDARADPLPASAPRDIEVEDTTKSHVADAAANEAADALIDQAEADPIRPGEPAAPRRRDG